MQQIRVGEGQIHFMIPLNLYSLLVLVVEQEPVLQPVVKETHIVNREQPTICRNRQGLGRRSFEAAYHTETATVSACWTNLIALPKY